MVKIEDKEKSERSFTQRFDDSMLSFSSKKEMDNLLNLLYIPCGVIKRKGIN